MGDRASEQPLCTGVYCELLVFVRHAQSALLLRVIDTSAITTCVLTFTKKKSPKCNYFYFYML